MLRCLDQAITVHRIGDAKGKFPVFSDEGARHNAGRWHFAGDPVIYASENYSTAMLEKLVRFNHILPPNQHRIEMTIPAGVSYEIFAEHNAMDWRIAGSGSAANFGHQWLVERRSTILFVPSAIAPIERNILINTSHGDFYKITKSLEEPVWWDDRLFT